MEFILKIKTDNAAFGEDQMDRASEIFAIMQTVSAQVYDNAPSPGDTMPVRDSNGNTVGQWSLA